MAINNFLVTGMGRSGTLFLSQFLQQGAQDYEIIHEGKNDRIHFNKCVKEPEHRPNFINVVNNRIKYKYGEVNSYLREIAPEIRVARRLVIIRDPYAILLSSINKGHENLHAEYIAVITRGLEAVSQLIQIHAIPHLKFERIIENPWLVSEFLGLPKPTIFPTVFQNASIKRFKNLEDVRYYKNDLPEKIEEFDNFKKEFYK